MLNHSHGRLPRSVREPLCSICQQWQDAIFLPLRCVSLRVRCDSSFIYIEANSYTAHETMTGISRFARQITVLAATVEVSF